MRAILTTTVVLLILTALAMGPTLAQNDASPNPVDQSISVKDSGAATDAKPAGDPPLPPKDLKGAAEQAKAAIAAAKEGRWWYFSALIVMLVMFLLKFAGTKIGSWWPKLGRWRYVIAPVLSLAGALLAAFQGGVSIDTAITVFTSSYATPALQELYEHGILGKPHSGGG